MSGILGIVNFDGVSVDQALLTRMIDFLSYRGPDAKNVWIDGNVGFGHTMLRTTLEAETESQPLTLDGKIWLTADARIDDRAEVLRKLRTEVTFGDNGNEPPNDAELILLAYHAWGEDCVERLLGDFAFAIWDNPNRRLFCARDHFGVKPFFYAHVGDVFLFSNTLNCLRLHTNVSSTLNELAIADYLLFGLNQDNCSTAFKDIHRLPPASTLTISRTSAQVRQYWALPQDGHVQYPNSSDYPERFRELLFQAVSDRLRTNRVSISMSGGLDSTSVAAVARNLLPKKGESEVAGCTVVYDRLIPDDERHFSGLAATSLQIPITHIPADDYLLYEESFPRALEQPEPFLVNPTAAQFYELLLAMANHSRVALTGWDGDALMSEPAHSAITDAARKFRVKTLVEDMNWFLARGRLPPIGFRTRLKRLVGSYPLKSFQPEWIANAFSQRLNLEERWKRFMTEAPAMHETRPVAFRALTSPNWGPLFDSYDAGTSRLALEVRHPMLDLRIVEFALSIPPIPWCVDKEILRVSMQGLLPAEILRRAKTPLAGFPALRLVEKSSVRFVDNFQPAPSFSDFVNVYADYRIAGEKNADRLWVNLRPFGLNHWLTHSLPTLSNNGASS